MELLFFRVLFPMPQVAYEAVFSFYVVVVVVRSDHSQNSSKESS